MFSPRFLALVTLLSGFVLVANAQPPRRPGGGPGGPGGPGGLPPAVERLKVKAVAEELKISQEQLEKLKAWSEDAPRRLQAAIQAAMQAEVYRQLGDVLTADQIKRLKQINLQAEGLRAFTNPEVSAALNLSDDQRAEIRKISEETTAAVREAFSGTFTRGERPSEERMAEARKKAQAIQADALAKAKGVLTAEQKRTWDTLMGEPFDVSSLPPTGFGFGFGGGFGGGFGPGGPPQRRPQPKD